MRQKVYSLALLCIHVECYNQVIDDHFGYILALSLKQRASSDPLFTSSLASAFSSSLLCLTVLGLSETSGAGHVPASSSPSST